MGRRFGNATVAAVLTAGQSGTVLNLRPVAPRPAAGRIYDRAVEEPTVVLIDPKVATYLLILLRSVGAPTFPQAHAEAIAHLEAAIGDEVPVR